jgi:hypothetical protein
MSGFDNYDNWKLASPYDDQFEVEIFQTEKFEHFSLDEDIVNDFDDQFKAFEYHVVGEEYDTREEYLEVCAENLADNLGLYGTESGALESYGNKEYEQYLDAVEHGYKGKFRGKKYGSVVGRLIK